MNGKSLSSPDILVLGDSFSAPNVWQSFLPQDGQHQTLSFHYNDAGCPENWVNWASNQAFPNVKTLVIEVVEREFVRRFKSASCQPMTPAPFEIAAANVNASATAFALTKDAAFLVRVWENTKKMEGQAGRIVSNEVINVPLKTTSLFSNRRADRLLFYKKDEFKKNWSSAEMAAAIENLKACQRAIQQRGWKFVLVVIPDKSTVYRQFMVNPADVIIYPDIEGAVDAVGIDQVRLRDYFEQQASQVKDLYSPNDTHLSPRGYQVLAGRIAEKL